MTGIEQFNFPEFDEAADTLRFYHGPDECEFICPTELDSKDSRDAAMLNAAGDPELYRDMTGETWGDLLSRDVRVIADKADGVIVLDGWEKSRGACLEVMVAVCGGKPIYDYEAWNQAAGGQAIYEFPVPPSEISDAWAALLEKPKLKAEKYALPLGKFFSAITREIDDHLNERLPDDIFERGPESDGSCVPASEFEMTEGEFRMTSPTGGQKGQKPQRTDLLPPEFLLSLSEVYGFGASKYDDHNYLKGYDWSLSFAAALRHLLAAMDGEWLDEESGLPHVTHTAWHMAALFMFERHGLGTDNRLFHSVERSVNHGTEGKLEQ
jgi:hypothetical protein